MTESKVSVCITTYNQAGYIDKCVRSVASQVTDVGLEILIGVDQCADDTLKIVRHLSESYPKVVRCLEHVERVGAYRNYQLTLEQASGSLVAYLDGDDFWLPDKLQAQLDFMKAHPFCPAVYTNSVVVDAAGNRIGLFTGSHPSEITLDYLIERGNFLHHGSVLFRAEHALSILGLDPPFLDYRIHTLLAKQGNLGFINCPLSAYRYNAPESIRISDNEQIRRLYWDAIVAQSGGPANRGTLRRGKAEFLRRVFFRSLRDKDPGLFAKWWKTVAATETGNKTALAGYCVSAVMRRLLLELRALLQGKGWLKGDRVFYQR